MVSFRIRGCGTYLREMTGSDDSTNASRDKRAELRRIRAFQSYPLRVAYDAQAFLSANGGTGKGVQLRNLLGPYSDSFVGFATNGQNHSGRPLVQGGLSSYLLWQQISLPYLLHRWRADFFLAPYNTAPLVIPKRTKLILVLHDLILLERFDMPSLRQRVNNECRRLLIPKAVSRAHIVLTVSSYSRQQITARFPSAQVQVIPCSIARSWFVGKHVKRLDERENYILAVTGNVPHKNPDRALEGYAAFVTKMDRSIAPRLRLVGLSDSRDLSSARECPRDRRPSPYRAVPDGESTSESLPSLASSSVPIPHGGFWSSGSRSDGFWHTGDCIRCSVIAGGGRTGPRLLQPHRRGSDGRQPGASPRQSGPAT